MGMSASQARLLTLTGRLHDVEYQAQNVMSQKLALATQRDEIYQDYCEALDTTEIKTALMINGRQEYINANFSSLCEFNKNRCVDYTLINNQNGKLIVSEEVKTAYEKYGHTDKYAFAWAVLGYENKLSNIDDANILTQLGIDCSKGYDYSQNENMGKLAANGDDLYMTDIELKAFNKHYPSKSELKDAYDNMIAAEDYTEKNNLYEIFRNTLYEVCGPDIYDAMNKNNNAKEWSEISEEFNYYVKLWEAINEAGGCEAIEKENQKGEAGDTWFHNMVNAGYISIKYCERTGKREWKDTSIATSTNENFLKEVNINDARTKKAEAKYEHELNLINDKDKKYDKELKDLETERSAITTEMDSIKKVRDDNIERTFGIFS